MILAERVGFEPTCPCGQDAFEAPPLRPLRYLSAREEPRPTPELSIIQRTSPPSSAAPRKRPNPGEQHLTQGHEIGRLPALPCPLRSGYRGCAAGSAAARDAVHGRLGIGCAVRVPARCSEHCRN